MSWPDHLPQSPGTPIMSWPDHLPQSPGTPIMSWPDHLPQSPGEAINPSLKTVEFPKSAEIPCTSNSTVGIYDLALIFQGCRLRTGQDVIYERLPSSTDLGPKISDLGRKLSLVIEYKFEVTVRNDPYEMMCAPTGGKQAKSLSKHKKNKPNL